MAPNPLSRYRLHGKVVTMDDDFRVLDPGIVYVDAGKIFAVQPSAAPSPAGFADSTLVRTRGTIFPGLIELHNHLSYDVLPLWDVPKRYTNRSQWGGVPAYRKLISGPMQVLGRTPGCVEAIVRYVECKCLLGGVTTSQGIALFSNQGIQQYYRGIVRNVEATDDAALPEAASRIPDIDAHDAAKFLERLRKAKGASLLHLSEGTDAAARKHFLALQLASGEWAITPALAGIHSAALKAADFQVLSERGGSMVWSPLSNLLLYGCTADVQAAKAAGVLMGIGSDWSPSGSKNLLGELKAARLVSQSLGGVFSDREIVAMATRNAARILKWQAALGSIEAGKGADLLVVAGQQGDPYERLMKSSEADIALVIIGGVARFGTESLVTKLGGGTEPWKVGKAKRMLNLDQDVSHPAVGALTLAAAADRLREKMQDLQQLAVALEDPLHAFFGGALDAQPPQWYLVLDHDDPAGTSSRPHLPFGAAGLATGEVTVAAAAEPLSQVLEPVPLDSTTVADDGTFLDRLAVQKNLPDFVKTGLPELY